jgi:hypothetical protein
MARWSNFDPKLSGTGLLFMPWCTPH